MPGVLKQASSVLSLGKVGEYIFSQLGLAADVYANPYSDEGQVRGSSGGELMGTIKLPRVLKQLQHQLPKANYKRQSSQPARLAKYNSNHANMSNDYSNPVTPKNSNKLLNEI